MAITLWEYVNTSLEGNLRNLLIDWHIKEGLGTPTIAKRLNTMGFPIEQRTVWRWIRDEDINEAEEKG